MESPPAPPGAEALGKILQSFHKGLSGVCFGFIVDSSSKMVLLAAYGLMRLGQGRSYLFDIPMFRPDSLNHS